MLKNSTLTSDQYNVNYQTEYLFDLLVLKKKAREKKRKKKYCNTIQ